MKFLALVYATVGCNLGTGGFSIPLESARNCAAGADDDWVLVGY